MPRALFAATPVPIVCLPDSAKQRTLALLLQSLDRLVGQGSTRVLERLETSLEVDERELEAQRCGQSLKNAPAGRDDLEYGQLRQSSLGRDGELWELTSRPMPSPGINPAYELAGTSSLAVWTNFIPILNALVAAIVCGGDADALVCVALIEYFLGKLERLTHRRRDRSRPAPP